MAWASGEKSCGMETRSVMWKGASCQVLLERGFGRITGAVELPVDVLAEFGEPSIDLALRLIQLGFSLRSGTLELSSQFVAFAPEIFELVLGVRLGLGTSMFDRALQAFELPVHGVER